MACDTTHHHPALHRRAINIGAPRAMQARRLQPLVFAAGTFVVSAIAIAFVAGGPRGVAFWAIGLLLSVIAGCTLGKGYPGAGMAVTSYALLSVAGCAFVLVYRHQYGLDFAPHVDDSYYFYQIGRMSSGLQSVRGNATLYEPCMHAHYSLAKYLFGDVRLLDLLPINWAIGAIVVTLSYRVCKNIPGSRLSPSTATAILMSNATFIDATVHLYRDGLMLVFLLLSILLVTERRTWLASAAALLCGMVRVANGILAVAFVTCLGGAIKKSSGKWTGIAVRAVVVATMIVALDHWVGLGGQLRTFETDRSGPSESIWSVASERSESIIGEGQGIDVTRSLIRAGPIGWAAVPVATLFAPMRVKAFEERVDGGVELSGRVRRFAFVGVVPGHVVEVITLCSWVVFGPVIVMGIWGGLTGNPLERVLVLLFFMTILGVAFISFQPRHRAAFIVLFPTIMAIGERAAMKRRSTVQLLRGLFVCAILGLNAFSILA